MNKFACNISIYVGGVNIGNRTITINIHWRKPAFSILDPDKRKFLSNEVTDASIPRVSIIA